MVGHDEAAVSREEWRRQEKLRLIEEAKKREEDLLKEIKAKHSTELVALAARHGIDDEQTRQIAANLMAQHMAKNRIDRSQLHYNDIEKAVGRALNGDIDQWVTEQDAALAYARAAPERAKQALEEARAKQAATLDRQRHQHGHYNVLKIIPSNDGPPKPPDERAIDVYVKAIESLVEDRKLKDRAQAQALRLIEQAKELEAEQTKTRPARRSPYEAKDSDPSADKVVMAEYGEFVRDREKLRLEIGRARTRKEREILKCQMALEAADYMTLTSYRIADQSEALAGGKVTRESAQFRHQASAYEPLRTVLCRAQPILEQMQKEKAAARAAASEKTQVPDRVGSEPGKGSEPAQMSSPARSDRAAPTGEISDAKAATLARDTFRNDLAGIVSRSATAGRGGSGRGGR
jgi:hypothetical protein